MASDSGGVNKTISLGPFGCSAVRFIVPDVLYVEIVCVARNVATDRQEQVNPEILSETKSRCDSQWREQSSHNEQEGSIPVVASDLWFRRFVSLWGHVLGCW